MRARRACVRLRRLGDTGVDDVVSEVFLAAWRRVDESPADALPWSLNIARVCCRIVGAPMPGGTRSSSAFRTSAASPAPDRRGTLISGCSRCSPL